LIRAKTAKTVATKTFSGLKIYKYTPRTPLGELTALPRPLAGFRGKGGKRRRRE